MRGREGWIEKMVEWHSEIHDIDMALRVKKPFLLSLILLTIGTSFPCFPFQENQFNLEPRTDDIRGLGKTIL